MFLCSFHNLDEQPCSLAYLQQPIHRPRIQYQLECLEGLIQFLERAKATQWQPHREVSPCN